MSFSSWESKTFRRRACCGRLGPWIWVAPPEDAQRLTGSAIASNAALDDAREANDNCAEQRIHMSRRDCRGLSSDVRPAGRQYGAMATRSRRAMLSSLPEAGDKAAVECCSGTRCLSEHSSSVLGRTREDEERRDRVKNSRAAATHPGHPDTLTGPTLFFREDRRAGHWTASLLVRPLAEGEASSGLPQDGKAASWASRQRATACKDSSPDWILPSVADLSPPLTVHWNTLGN